MDKKHYAKNLKFPVILITLGVLAFGFTCAGMFSHAFMHDSPTNSAITISEGGQQECCNTSISKHIEQWKGALFIPPKEIRDSLILLLAGLALLFISNQTRLRHDFGDIAKNTHRLYVRDNPDFVLFDHIKLAFARGILNTKIY